MARKFYTGIDIGTQQVKVVIAAQPESAELPLQILASASAPARGVRQGYIVERAEAAKSVREAIARAQSAARVVVKHARVAIGGIGLEEMRSSGDTSLTASGSIVSERDIEKALRESEKRAQGRLTNRTILHTIPLEYRVDGIKVFGKPHGLQGTKLSVDTLLITALTQHQDEMMDVVEAAGVEIEGVMASPLAASLGTLTRSQKTAGVLLANIGAETLSLVVFEEDTPVSLKMLPLGSGQITNALALSFQIPLTEAEQMKRGAVTGSDIPAKKTQTIVQSQLKTMFTQVNAHLKAIQRAQLLPAGAVLTGGGSGLGGATEVARAVLKLPAQVAIIGQSARATSLDPSYAVAYGLCRWGFAEDTSIRGTSLGEVLSQGWHSFKESFRSLLP